MAVNQGPQISRSGLVAHYDVSNEKSFRGLTATNLMYGINNNYSAANDGTHFKTVYGSESVFIPYFNQLVTCNYVDIYNDYNAGSGQCCPSPFYYHSGTLIAVSGSTTYMYQIIFKTDTGYYHPNYMYRYEYGNSGYITEAGLVNASRLESLGDGWYHAWGSFTTNAATTTLYTYLFHYEYATWNRIRVAGVCLTQGSLVHRPEHFINFGYRTSRGNTVASGGGLKDLVGSNDAELVNGVSYTSGNGGSLSFDGTNDYVLVATGNQGPLSSIGTGDFTLCCWATNTGTGNYRWMISNWATTGVHMGINPTSNRFGGYFGDNLELSSDYSVPTDNSWHFYCTTRTSGTIRFYVDGIERTMSSGTPTGHSGSIGSSVDTRIGIRSDSISQLWIGNINSLYFHNRALSAAEILTLYNATRARFTQSTNRNILLNRQLTSPKDTNSLMTSVILHIDPANKQTYTPGSQYLYDLSPNRRTMTMYVNGGTTYYLTAWGSIPLSTDGKGSLQFDGTNDWIWMNSNLTISTLVTVSVWVKISAGGDRGIISHCSGGPVNLGYSIETTMKYLYYTGGWYATNSYVTINDGIWKNVVWVKNGTNLKMYVNGILDREVTLVGDVSGLLRGIGALWGPCNSNNGIPGGSGYGPGADSYGSVFNGLMGPLILFSRAISGSEVTQLYNNYRSRFNHSVIVTSGLVLHLNAADRTSYPGSGTTWTDLSGNGNTGTLTNGPTFDSARGGSIVFDGSNDYIGCGAPSTLAITGSITTEVWVNFSSKNNASDMALIGRYSNAGGAANQAWLVFLSTNNYQVYGPGNTGPLSGEIAWLATSAGNFDGALIGSGEQVSINTWYHVVTVNDSSANSLLIYINGSIKRNVVRTNQTSGVLATGARNIEIGYTSGDGARPLQGRIPISRIYNRALSAAEVLQNFNTERWRFGI